MPSDLIPPPPPPPELLEAAPVAEGQLPALSPPWSSNLPGDSFFGLFEPERPELDNAISFGDRKCVSAELQRARENYPYPNVTFNTALQRAIDRRRPEIVSLLLSRGVPAKERDLEAAVATGNMPVAACLIDHLAWNVNAVARHGWILLTLAVSHEEMFGWLLSNGADPNLQDAWAETPLSRAAQDGPLSVIDRLLDAEVDLSRGSPLHMSIGRGDDAASLDLMERFIALGAPVDKYDGEDSSKWEEVGFPRVTALHSASKRGKMRAVELLLSHGADPSRNKKIRSDESCPSLQSSRKTIEGNVTCIKSSRQRLYFYPSWRWP